MESIPSLNFKHSPYSSRQAPGHQCSLFQLSTFSSSLGEMVKLHWYQVSNLNDLKVALQVSIAVRLSPLNLIPGTWTQSKEKCFQDELNPNPHSF